MNTTKMIKKINIAPRHLIPVEFFMLIIVGALILLLPVCTASGEHTTPLTALFTSTTCVCVTGLVVVDTFSHWSLFGQFIILILIQVGGLGIVAVSSSVLLALKNSFSLKERLLLADAFGLDRPKGIGSFLRFVFACTFITEGIGALLYCIYFIPRFGFFKGLWTSIFLSVSAYCNAGIDTISADSMIPFHSNTFLLVVTMLLITLGGIGFVVYLDFYETLYKKRREFKRRRMKIRLLSEHTRLVCLISALLVFTGAILVLLLEYNNTGTLGDMSIKDKILNSVFQSVTFRTAGFATVPQENLSYATTMVGDILMFIGGSPIGTAGGVKTVTFAVILLNTLSFIYGNTRVTIFHRNVDANLIRKAAAIVAVNLTFVVIFTLLLLSSDNVSLADGLYEIQSALSTVGLTRSLTPNLSSYGKIIVIIAMYLGRIGPISMTLFFVIEDDTDRNIKNANGRFFL